MSTFTLRVGRDRDAIGVLEMRDGAGILIVRVHALARADNAQAALHGNPDRSTLLLFGDLPTGTYDVSEPFATGTATHPTRPYGPNGALRLTPTGGDARLAAQNGRVGLLIHGGDLSRRGSLRATHGCLRLHNDDMAALIAAWWIHSPLACVAAVGAVGTVELPRRFDPTDDDAGALPPHQDPPPLTGEPLPRPPLP